MTNKITIGAAAVLLSCGIAAAAEMPVVTKGPIPIATWTGFYAGLGIGLRSTDISAQSLGTTQSGTGPDTCNTLSPPFPNAGTACFFSQPFNDTTTRFQFYGGYNWQIDPSVVVGIEADAGWANRTTTITGSPYPGGTFLGSGLTSDSFSINPTWDASVRARYGYLITPNFLVYATGGGAWLRFKSTATCGQDPFGSCAPPVPPFTIADVTTRFGWTVGGGIETRVFPNVLVRGEYRYAEFGKVTIVDNVAQLNGGVASTSYEVHPRTHTALIGIAYLFGGYAAAPAVYK